MQNKHTNRWWNLDQNLRNDRSMISANHLLRLICDMQQLTESPVVMICFHKIGLNYYVILQVYMH